jgi:hypothetical protein
MLTSTERLENLTQLRSYITKRLCEVDQLEVGVFPLTERILVRSDQPCGIFFCLHGPRSTKLTAVWETESNTVLFYCSRGERFLRTRLMKSLDCREETVQRYAEER